MSFKTWLLGDGQPQLRAEGMLTEYRQSSLADGPQWLIDAWGGTQTLALERVSVDGSLNVADVFTAVDIIAEQVSQLPLKVFRDLSQTPGNPGTGVVEAPDHRCWWMLHDMPNAFTPADRFWSTVTVHHLLWGNWFLEKLRGPDGLVSELRLIHPTLVDVFYSELAGTKSFLITRSDGRREGPFGQDRILHGFGLSKDGLTGMSRIEHAREALGTTKARRHFEAEVYAQKPFLSGVIEHPSQIKSTVKLRESWQSIYAGGHRSAGEVPSSRHGVAVLEEGAHFNPITAPLADMQFVEMAQMSKTEIAALFKLPPSYLGGSTGDSLTYQTVESNKIQLATQAIAPVANTIAQALSHDPGLFPFASWYAEFVLEGMMRGDSGARAEYWTKMKEVLNLDPAYIAAKENIPQEALMPEPVALPPSEEVATIGNQNVGE